MGANKEEQGSTPSSSQNDHDAVVTLKAIVEGQEKAIEKLDGKLEKLQVQLGEMRSDMLTKSDFKSDLQAMEARLLAAIDKKASNERVDALSTDIKAEIRTDFSVLNTKVEERVTSVKWFIAAVMALLGLLGTALKYDFFTSSKDSSHTSGTSAQEHAGSRSSPPPPAAASSQNIQPKPQAVNKMSETFGGVAR